MLSVSYQYKKIKESNRYCLFCKFKLKIKQIDNNKKICHIFNEFVYLPHPPPGGRFPGDFAPPPVENK